MINHKILVPIMVLALAFGTAGTALAKGGGRGGGGARASTSRPSTSTVKPSTSSVKPSAPSKPATPRVTTKPSSSTVKVASATTVKSSTGKTMSKKGNVVGSTYQPRFSGGYVPPAGSVVYYRENSLMDWIPLYLILTSQSHREAVVQTTGTDGKVTEQTVKEEGVDTMYIINWIVTILFGLGLIALIVYFVNSRTKKEEALYV